MASLAEIRKQIEVLQKEAEDLIKKEKASVIEEIKRQIADYQISAAELGFSSSATSVEERKPARKAAAEPLVKYRNEAGETWSGGRGRKPQWIKELEAAGGDIEQYRVNS